MKEKLSKIKMLAMDVDGTLTDGSMVFLGDEEVKLFSALDGLGIRLAMNYGLGIAWITGNTSEAVTVRAEKLGLRDVYQGSKFKTVALDDLIERHNLALDEVAYIGDDLNDLPVFEKVGFAFAVSNAVDEVKQRAAMITTRPGGSGAVREAIETILKARGAWDSAVAGFLARLEKEETEKAGPEAVA